MRQLNPNIDFDSCLVAGIWGTRLAFPTVYRGPIRNFFDLRRGASKLIAQYSYETFGPLSMAAKDDYRKIGAQLVAFA